MIGAKKREKEIEKTIYLVMRWWFVCLVDELIKSSI